MARPQKNRKIDSKLKLNCYRPVWIDESTLERVEIDPCEMQAIKLSQLDNLSQAESAKYMEVSASTFNRILKSGNSKIADALINGKAIKIITH